MKEDMSLSNLGTLAFQAAKVPTNVFSSTLICLLTLDYVTICLKRESAITVEQSIQCYCTDT